MKKLPVIICALLLGVSSSIFAQHGINIAFSGEVQSTFLFRPYVATDIKAEYEFKNEIGLGIGVKETYNVIQHHSIESYGYLSPYILFTYKNFDLGGGITVLGDTEISPFLTIGGNAVIKRWDNGGKLNFTYGLDGYFSLVMLAEDSDDEAENLGNALVSALLIPLSIPKAYIGIKYTLPVSNLAAASKAKKMQTKIETTPETEINISEDSEENYTLPSEE